MVAPRVGAWIETTSAGETDHELTSPLAWGRGSKPLRQEAIAINVESPLAWGRGSKRDHRCSPVPHYSVAPRVGAWIETITALLHIEATRVAPRVGAWIETSSAPSSSGTRSVAPRVGAWIETVAATLTTTQQQESPLAWGRGSKLHQRVPRPRRALSPLAWGRGSKLYGRARIPDISSGDRLCADQYVPIFSGHERLRRRGGYVQHGAREPGKDNHGDWGVVPSSLGLIVVSVPPSLPTSLRHRPRLELL